MKNKAHELAVLCQVDLAVIILGNNNSKFYEYSSVNSNELINKFQDKRFVHEIKAPSDYGDYETKSRVRGNKVSHTRNTSTNSFSMSIDEDDESEGEGENDEDEDDEDEEEEESKPAPKRRKKDNKKSTKITKQDNGPVSQPGSQQIPHAQPQSLLPPPNVGAITSQQDQQQQQQMPQQGQVPYQFYPPQYFPNAQQHPQGTPPMIQGTPPMMQGFYTQEGFQSLPIQQQQQIQQQFARGQYPQQFPFPPQQFPFQVQDQYSQHPQQQQQQQPPLPQQQQQQQQQVPPPPPFVKPDGTTSGSSTSSTPIIPNSKPASMNSPFTTSSTRARSLNNNINSRPILRVKIPLGENDKNNRDVKNGDSAKTVTAIETSKNDTRVPIERNNTNDDQKDSSDGKESSSNVEEKTPTTGESKNDENYRPGLGILSNKSTPISATLPSGLFSLPPPNPNPQYQNHFNNNSSNLNNNGNNNGTGGGGGGNFKPPLKINTGEQTPLTGGLPSRYVPDLFPSPSNFYSNEWNIPFGSGNTPYPNSALPQGGSNQLPNINNVGNNKFNKHSNLTNQDFNGPQSPLQNTPLRDYFKKKKDGDDDDKDFSSKKIKFGKPE
ncbi:Translation initiation factor IF-2 [Wickerhamomyces ciferrii]|uniref:Translation initiation factor IF-2 n=1 Tax=Wickerhamomyces ciferrii (strain ATCC 14091 / BCRC 22168 / CBS 111 / JCM 3599 / NBRC 0793 / NRRL Y-1031 F-60-10) TaxID=1206466 RepID=K0K790_WICCF|nr:Translation initiation factor IF-2 [Wickerhamomyces ciferrii]CCH40710.1 Translation initiation factor IF-2 [Wickerhamomyces ciferrii]